MKFNSFPTPIPLSLESVAPPILYDAFAAPETVSSPAVAAKEIAKEEIDPVAVIKAKEEAKGDDRVAEANYARHRVRRLLDLSAERGLIVQAELAEEEEKRRVEREKRDLEKAEKEARIEKSRREREKRDLEEAKKEAQISADIRHSYEIKKQEKIAIWVGVVLVSAFCAAAFFLN